MMLKSIAPCGGDPTNSDSNETTKIDLLLGVGEERLRKSQPLTLTNIAKASIMATEESQLKPAAEPRRQSVTEKRRKARRQSGHTVEKMDKESVRNQVRLERSDSDRVIRRNSIGRRVSQRKSSIQIGSPEFLKGLGDLGADLLDDSGGMKGDSQGRLSGSSGRMSASLRRLSTFTNERSQPVHAGQFSHPLYTEEQMQQFSQQALDALSDSDDSSCDLALDEPITLVDAALL